MLKSWNEEAEQVREAIAALAEKNENLDNFIFYLSNHFGEWLTQYANTPESFVAELTEFAFMEI